MLGRLRVLLITGLVVLPVTADLRRGFVWSEASAQKQRANLESFPWCSFIRVNWYNFGVWSTSNYATDIPESNCVLAQCMSRGLCVSEVNMDCTPGCHPVANLNLIQDCIARRCIRMPAVRPPPFPK